MTQAPSGFTHLHNALDKNQLICYNPDNTKLMVKENALSNVQFYLTSRYYVRNKYSQQYNSRRQAHLFRRSANMLYKILPRSQPKIFCLK